MVQACRSERTSLHLPPLFSLRTWLRCRGSAFVTEDGAPKPYKSIPLPIHLLAHFAIPALLFVIFGMCAAKTANPQFSRALQPFLNGQSVSYIAEVSISTITASYVRRGVYSEFGRLLATTNHQLLQLLRIRKVRLCFILVSCFSGSTTPV